MLQPHHSHRWDISPTEAVALQRQLAGLVERNDRLDEVIGAVVRSRNGVAPLYISTGHRVSLATAIHYLLACTTRYRLPETTRCAHRLASRPAP